MFKGTIRIYAMYAYWQIMTWVMYFSDSNRDVNTGWLLVAISIFTLSALTIMSTITDNIVRSDKQ